MKKLFCLIAALTCLAVTTEAQTSPKVYNREITAGTGVLIPADEGNPQWIYGIHAARFNDWGGGVRVGVDYAEIPYANSMMVDIPLHLALRADIPWFIGFDIFDDFFWSMAMQSDSFEESVFYIVAGAIVAFLPKCVEINGGISPGYVASNSNYRTYYTGDILTRDGFSCSADIGLRATAKMGRLGFFIAPELRWQLTPSLYSHNSHYDENRLFLSYTFGFTLAF